MKLLCKILGLFIAPGLFGCATPTEEQRYERAEREVLRLEKFARDDANCAAAGGSMVVKRRSRLAPRCNYETCPPKRGEAYYCVRL